MTICSTRSKARTVGSAKPMEGPHPLSPAPTSDWQPWPVPRMTATRPWSHEPRQPCLPVLRTPRGLSSTGDPEMRNRSSQRPATQHNRICCRNMTLHTGFLGTAAGPSGRTLHVKVCHLNIARNADVQPSSVYGSATSEEPDLGRRSSRLRASHGCPRGSP